jgi:transglutaminase-like putative cysteine protease
MLVSLLPKNTTASPMLNSRFYTLALLLLLLAFGFACQNKKGVPQAGADAAAVKATATIADVEKGIREYIQTKTKNDSGYFTLVNDSMHLKLRLVRVHTEYLSVLDSHSYFACVDLADTNGDVYDVDFFLSGPTQNMQVTETTVHKLNGRPFYTWQQMADKTWQRQSANPNNTRLLGVVEEQDNFEFYYQLQIPKLSDSANLWLPMPQSDAFQTVGLLAVESPVRYQKLKDQEHGNAIFYAELGPESSGQQIKLSYRVQRLEKSAYTGKAPAAAMTLAPSPLLPTDGRFTAIVKQVLQGKEQESNLVKARALYDYVSGNLRYAKQGTYGTGDANYACDSKSGNCTEFHSLFISLARTAGIPSRFAIGAALPAARDEGGVNGYHCWAEFYANEQWWPVDISEANKYAALSTYYFGHHPANRIELSRGRDLKINPGPKSGAIPFMAYPIIEENGQRKTVKTTFGFKRLPTAS